MSIKTKVAEHFWLKIVSLFLALLLWLFASSGMEGEIAVTAPVKYLNLSPGLAVGDNAPGSVDFRIAGPKMLLWRVKGETLKVSLDLNGVGAGDVTYTHLEKYVERYSGLHVIRVYPATITLHVSKVGKGNR